MNFTVDSIVELCVLLGSYADRLKSLRSSPPESTSRRAVPASGDNFAGSALWGGSLGAAHALSAPTRWYQALDPHYRELDNVIRSASPALCAKVLADPRVLEVQPRLHRLRAAYEYDKEVAQAQAILSAGDGRRLARLVEQESYWALGSGLCSALSGARNVLLAGSGPLPLTALCIASALNTRVTCVERDLRSFHLGRSLIAASEHRDSISSIEAEIAEIEDLDPYDAVVGTVLVGVDLRRNDCSLKTEIWQRVLARLRPGATCIIRDPHGLGRLLYPAVELTNTLGIELTRWLPKTGPGHPYRSALIMARRLDSNPRYAH